ncbi:HAD family hydrolase [Caldimonas tepidiphila]|uniref:HAD family hydrolase n=1 Tax=Caldimonas tepidiphila TaxID=2315841 RepID=UPI000E5B08FD|nr:HAD-IB family hydrolase [Caldimonas tepidiphila]
MRLALFDLDHTLIPFDSGMAWTGFLVGRGVLPPDADELYLSHCRQYVEGRLDIRALHRATVAPLGAHPRSTVAAWAAEFEAAVAPRLVPGMQELVRRHREAGDLCALVTATTRFIAEPFGRLFDIRHVLATESACLATPDGGYSGEIDGEPCWREHKVARVHRWLAQAGLRLEDFERSWFYSDSASDLPLLEAVTDPMAVRPDARLRALALQRGWRILEA